MAIEDLRDLLRARASMHPELRDVGFLVVLGVPQGTGSKFWVGGSIEDAPDLFRLIAEGIGVTAERYTPEKGKG